VRPLGDSAIASVPPGTTIRVRAPVRRFTDDTQEVLSLSTTA
jgi:hypothetical protein